MTNTLDGIAYACFSACAFGSMYVPMKKYPIYDGVRFQLYMCTGILLVGLTCSVLDGDLASAAAFGPMLGGGLNGIANFLLLRLVDLLGIGVGYSLFHFAGLPMGYLIGRLGLWGVPRAGDALADCGAGVVLLSFTLLSMIRNADICEGDDYHGTRFEYPLISGSLDVREEKKTLSRQRTAKAIAIPLALASGAMSAISNVPVTLWNLDHPGRPLAPILPMYTGIWLASVVLSLFHEVTCRILGVESASPRRSPALACGAIWGIGYAGFVMAIHLAGFEASFVIGCIGSILVSGFLSVFWFKEVHSCRSRFLFSLAFALQVAGVLMMARLDPLK
mmetsp:Transcript_160168/g.513896  ORF Transcript_160168/g.513896 Transcript_160168/m.513896 type:complete len:334 (+) Transcript_160168:55-1056(+)|eukprot:CAMPEP_0203921138 /NCGR_PEP_ID=MMETSP0359-20131031/61326_1 /ASSEMBLY_ACC=CAM_ASM_000338 /TAXON_ID=268821 /ORGANISM="Scrippsiella Hangoei, Strain SHTV-5" /LENGTH=333 /DNA_ID=CAMNT_0050848763 /DNA_START=1 /DNA_END=1002 /DNA_ORIENTATION=+